MPSSVTPQAPALKVRIDGDIEQRRFIQYDLRNCKGGHHVVNPQLKIEVAIALVAGKCFFTPRKSVGAFFNLKCCG